MLSATNYEVSGTSRPGHLAAGRLAATRVSVPALREGSGGGRNYEVSDTSRPTPRGPTPRGPDTSGPRQRAAAAGGEAAGAGAMLSATAIDSRTQSAIPGPR